jgi:hypothetical protein
LFKLKLLRFKHLFFWLCPSLVSNFKQPVCHVPVPCSNYRIVFLARAKRVLHYLTLNTICLFVYPAPHSHTVYLICLNFGIQIDQHPKGCYLDFQQNPTRGSSDIARLHAFSSQKPPQKAAFRRDCRATICGLHQIVVR